MKFVFLASLFLGSLAFADKGYDLQMDFSLKGKHVFSPRILVKAGEKATVTQGSGKDSSFIEVIATEGEVLGNNGIMLSLTVGTIDKNGARTIISRPKILAAENSAARMTMGETETGGEEMSLTVTPKRIEL